MLSHQLELKLRLEVQQSVSSHDQRRLVYAPADDVADAVGIYARVGCEPDGRAGRGACGILLEEEAIGLGKGAVFEAKARSRVNASADEKQSEDGKKGVGQEGHRH